MTCCVTILMEGGVLMKQKNFSQSKFMIAILVIIFYVLIYIPNSILPMISDDFWYGKTDGNIFLVSIQHYLNWSGRFLTDMTSRIILPYPAIASSVKTIALVALIILISILPSIIVGRNIFSKINLYLIFITYWICNPNLGQTTFWTVGASNYLFTNVWILIYLNLVFFLFHQDKVRSYQYIILGIAAFAAGLSNENMGPTILLFSVGMTVYAFRTHKKINIWLTSSGLNLLGSAILILSPGNRVRLDSLPSKFNQLTLGQRVYNFFTVGDSSKLFSNYGFLFLIFVCLIGFLFLKKRVSKELIGWSLTFSILAIIANFAFMFSPMMMLRSLQGGFILFLVSLSFLVSELVSSNNSKTSRILFVVMLSVMTGLFIVSYGLEINSFRLARAESNIRTSRVLKAQENYSKSVIIPSWYKGELLRPKNDSYDTYLSPYYGKYYGYEGDIREVEVPFDYTNINNFKNNVEYVTGGKLIKGVKSVKNVDSNCSGVIVFLKSVDSNCNVDLKIQYEKETKDYTVPMINELNIQGYKFVSLDLDRIIFNGDVKKAQIIVTDSDKQVEEHSINIFN